MTQERLNAGATSLTGVFAFGRFVLQPEARQLLDGGTAVKLGARAFDLLLALVERRGRVVGKNELLEVVWPGLVVEEGNLAVHVSSLRKLLGDSWISTVPGRGYRFTMAQAAEPEPEPVLAVTGNLPGSLPNLVARDAELEALAGLLRSHRLVTVLGAGGIGKSRLALAAAREEGDHLPDGAWLVELGSVNDAALVPAAVAQVLGVTLAGRGDATGALVAAVQARCLLLLLDNCEHLLAATAALATALLAGAPRLRLLATSRAPLRLPAEQQLRIAPLPVAQSPATIEEASGGAVALFVARARAAEPRFALTPGNLQQVLEICRRLDGLPLAIELAAARVGLLGVAGVHERLDQRFRVLTAGARDALPQHQTLHATFEWSHALLDAPARAVLRRLSVFSGGFDLESAQRVAADAGLDEWAVLDHLGTLVEHSLVVADPGEVPRYRLLESQRAWAREKLAAAGEAEEVHRLHAAAVLALFERSHAQRWTVPANQRLDRYLPDLDNLRAALDWAGGRAQEAALHVGLAGAGAWVWFRLDRSAEGARRCEQALARIDATTPARDEARLLGAWSQMAGPHGGAAERAAAARAALLYRGLDDRPGLYVALCDLATSRARGGELAAAEAALEEAFGLWETGWPPALRWVELVAAINLRWRQGRIGSMRESCEAQLALAESLGNSFWRLHALNYLVQATLVLGRVEEALALARDLLDQSRRERFVGDLPLQALASLCMALVEAGELDEARSAGLEALELAQRWERPAWLLFDRFALLALRRGRTGAAARLLGYIEQRQAAEAAHRSPDALRLRAALEAGLAPCLDAAALARERAAGAGLDEAAAMRLACEEAG